MNKNIFIYRYLIVVLLICITIEKSYGNTNEYRIVELKSNNSILTQSMLKTADTRYIIKNDLDLNHSSINIPRNCILVFEGGSLKNGEIIGDFIVHADAVQIFDNLICRDLRNSSILIEWFGAKSYRSLDECKKGKDSSSAIQNVLKSNYRHRDILFSNGYYRIDNTIIINRSYSFKGLTSKEDYSIYSEGNIGSRLVFTATGKPMFIIDDNNISFDGLNFYHGILKDGTDCFHFSKTARSLVIKNSIIYAWRYCIYKDWDGVSRTGMTQCRFENVKFSSCVGGVFMNQVKEGKEMYYCTANFFDNCTFEHCHFGVYFISNSNFAMNEFNRCNFYNIGWDKYYDKNLYDEFGCFALRFNCKYARSQSSHVIIKGCYFEDIAPYKEFGKPLSKGEIVVGNKVFPKDDVYYSCIISENNSLLIDGCSFTNCPKYFASDKYCSWDIRENRIFGYNIITPSFWKTNSLIRIFHTNKEVKLLNHSRILYSNVLGNNNMKLNSLISFENEKDSTEYSIVNLFE